MDITKKVINPQTKQTFVTISEKHETQHTILRLEEGLDIKKNDYVDMETGIKSQFTIFKKKEN